MNWPPLELRIDESSAHLYAAGIEQMTIPKSETLTDDALNAAFSIVHRYGRDLPLSIYDDDQTWTLLLTVDGQTIDTTESAENPSKFRKSTALVIAGVTIVILIVTLTVILVGTHAAEDPQPASTSLSAPIDTPLHPVLSTTTFL